MLLGGGGRWRVSWGRSLGCFLINVPFQTKFVMKMNEGAGRRAGAGVPLPALICETASGSADTRAVEIYAGARLDCTPLHSRLQRMGEGFR